MAGFSSFGTHPAYMFRLPEVLADLQNTSRPQVQIHRYRLRVQTAAPARTLLTSSLPGGGALPSSRKSYRDLGMPREAVPSSPVSFLHVKEGSQVRREVGNPRWII